MAEVTAPAAHPVKPRSKASIRSETAFRARLVEVGATLLESTYLGSNKPHRTLCRNGHECRTWPSDVTRGRGFCRVCSGRDSGTAESAFRVRVEELGGTVLEAVWKGTREPHRVRCGFGHESTPRPKDLKVRAGICRTCAGLEPLVAEARFRARVEALGGTVVGSWVNSNTAVLVLCRAGHELRAFPSNVARPTLCRICSGRHPQLVEATFRARVEELGGVVLEPTWRGALAPHRVRCAQGHVTFPWPSSIQQGAGLCRFCAGKAWDVFYVVEDDEMGTVKFGITSGDPRPRLQDHARAGLRRVVLLLTDLPNTAAPDLERLIVAALRDAGEDPVRGKEYFPARVLPLIVRVVENVSGLRSEGVRGSTS